MPDLFNERPFRVGSYVIATFGRRSHEARVTAVHEDGTVDVRSSDTGQRAENLDPNSVRHYYAANH